MIPYPFTYHKATSVEDAIAKLQNSGGDAKWVAGGHSLIPSMKLRLSDPTTLIDLQGLDGLKSISDGGNEIHIGALATHRSVEHSALLKEKCAVVATVAGGIGDPQVRNKGTIGGSLAHADPSADYPAIILALGASISVQGPGGSRTISADDFFTGMFDTALDEHELITKVSVPVMSGSASASYAKFANPASRYAIVGAAAYVEKDAQGNCTAARIAITGAAASVFRATAMENALVGQPFNEASIQAASAHAPDPSDLFSDLSATAAYRAHLCTVMVKRALMEC